MVIVQESTSASATVSQRGSSVRRSAITPAMMSSTTKAMFDWFVR